MEVWIWVRWRDGRGRVKKGTGRYRVGWRDGRGRVKEAGKVRERQGESTGKAGGR